MWADESGRVYTHHHEIRASLPKVSLPAVITDAMLAPFGFTPVEEDPAPAVGADEALTERIEKRGNRWVKVKEKRPATPDERRQRRDAAEAEAVRRIAATLADTTWTQLLDAPTAVQQAYATYRRAVRDVPKQAGYPLNIDWPVKP